MFSAVTLILFLTLTHSLSHFIFHRCDQMLSKKQHNYFQKVAQKVANAVFYESEGFQNSPKSCQSFGLLLLEILLSKTFKNRPIWPHCTITHLLSLTDCTEIIQSSILPLLAVHLALLLLTGIDLNVLHSFSL